VNVDKLEGRELDAAVASMLDGFDAQLHIYKMDDGTLVPGTNVPRYHADIAAAIDELDGEDWAWAHMELSGLVPAFVERPDGKYVAFAKLADFPTKSAAYATTHCRCFVKAMAAQQTPEDSKRDRRQA